MSKKVRFHAKVKGYYFPDFNGLFWHSNSFWLHEQKVKVVFNNGEITLTDSYPF